ncbi:DNA mismatch repair protein MutS [Terrisporobacter sp.]|uniref:DNA mismatch repair protein MutS n=1 Tax=Terrisporobacter sp. TaxID=1965305 RepID=UPI00262E21DD|nr:DNA mismatch repair protein MutS [Terrisporobacter sp.]
MEIDRQKLTPMMKQYFECKDKYPDCILFFRLGDFYEMFFEDAIVASKVLEIALTGKSCGLEERAPMCGIPFHAANSYISKLLESGYKVAVGEQMEDPQSVKGIVKREVIRVVTPGTVLEGNLLENKKNNYLMSLYKENDNIGLSYVDISTGETNATLIGRDKIIEEIAKVSPSEIILNDISFKEDLKNIATLGNIYINESFNENYLNINILNEYFSDDYLNDLKFDDDNLIKNSLCILLNYIYNTQKQITSNINHINIYNPMEYMVLDMFTRINLELTQTMRGSKKKGSLLHVLDKTSTAMGGRLLRKYVEEPLVNKKRIDERLDVIEEIKNDFSLREDLIDILKNVYDVERICGKIAFEKVTPKEMINLRNSIEKLPLLSERINYSNGNTIKKYIDNMEDLNDIYELINNSIMEEPSITIKDGNIIKSSYNEELKELRNISKNGAFMIKEIENREREKTGVKSLKIGFNKVFGYYIEITKVNLASLDLEGRYIRKQTLSNAERFITEELKEIEDKILHAEEKIKALEYDIFVKIRQTIYNNIDRIQNVAKIIANIDVFTSFATVAHMNNYVKPLINENSKLDIKNGRHPVIESIVGEENFVPNDTYLNSGENIINIITGPNMAGKSTYMRQTAIITLMAHMGSFVPAEYANIPICDRIFTRVGASDDLSQGQSTFMVEMSEVSHILKNATNKSLVILDEIGRGTSTYDGISLAWSIVEYIEKNIKCKTLFATHYHELTDLENEFTEVKNYSIAVKDDGENIIFLRKIIDQAADKSYGIYVAKLAKLPNEVINRSSQILKELEKNHVHNGYAINGNINEIISNESTINSEGKYVVKENTISEIELELKKLEESNLKNEFEALKLEKESINKTYKKLKRDYDRLNDEFEKLNNNINQEVAVSVDQISFDIVNDNNIINEIKELDILSMTPLDAMNALFNIQKKVKNKN